MGVFEIDKFAAGSKAVLEAIVAATEKGATSIIGELEWAWLIPEGTDKVTFDGMRSSSWNNKIEAALAFSMTAPNIECWFENLGLL